MATRISKLRSDILQMEGMVKSCMISVLHKILWVAVSSTVGLRVERRPHLQSVCLQDVVLVDQTDENRLGLTLVSATASTLQPSLIPKRFSSDDDEMMPTFNTKSYYG
ncbi:hypothetical protein AVEN_71003-1 [Araneus ventricosus]|uniref:Uncharacterized protein n=1 Tax=Araneus ventricosus TaxID=182803 RepID=A0A4Y2G918_ARAVE|nr:hypothetical protein AVEN_71003-1 [Araneus ventricosus]